MREAVTDAAVSSRLGVDRVSQRHDLFSVPLTYCSFTASSVDQ